MTTFAELLAGLDDDTIVARIGQLYPTAGRRLDPSPYRQVLATLRTMAPQPSACRLVLQWITDIDKPRPWVTVFGVENYQPVAIEYMPWAQWLGMTVDADTTLDFPAVDIAAHALWEMTYAGFDETAIQERLREIRDAPLLDAGDVTTSG